MCNSTVFTDPLIRFIIEYLPAVSPSEIGVNMPLPIIMYLFLSLNLILWLGSAGCNRQIRADELERIDFLCRQVCLRRLSVRETSIAGCEV